MPRARNTPNQCLTGSAKKPLSIHGVQLKVSGLRIQYRHLTSKHARIAGNVTQCIASALIAMGYGKPMFLRENRTRKFLRGFYLLVCHIYLIAATRGAECILKIAKALATEARLAVSESRRPIFPRYFAWLASVCKNEDQLLQLSYVGRALPYGTEKQVKIALEEHKEVYVSQHVTEPALLAELTRFTKDLFARSHGSLNLDILPIPRSEGACLEKTVKQGGLQAYCTDVLADPRIYPLQEKYKQRIAEVGHVCPDAAADIEVLTSSAAYRDVLLQRLADEVDGREPSAQVLCLVERGAKTRVVTKSPGSLVALAHHLRKVALRVLRRSKHAGLVLSGERRGAVEKLFEGLPPFKLKRKVVSADLTAASDRIPLDAALAIWEAISDALDLPGWARWVAKLANGPQLLSYPCGTRLVSQRGILMGLPTTWVTLSILHMFWAQRQSAIVGENVGPQPYVICGDDLVGLWTQPQIEAYELVVSKFGGKFSAGKHYVSARFGVFTEELFFVKVVEGPTKLFVQKGERKARVWFPPVGELQKRPEHFEVMPRIPNRAYRRRGWIIVFDRWSSAFSLKSLVERPSNMPNSLTKVPWWMAIGPAMSTLRGDRKRIVRVVKYNHPGIYSRFRRWGFLPHLPRALGGVGLLGRTNAELRARSLPRLYQEGLFSALNRDNGFYKPRSCFAKPWVITLQQPARELGEQIGCPSWGQAGTMVGDLAFPSQRQRRGRVTPPGFVAVSDDLRDFYTMSVEDATSQLRQCIPWSFSSSVVNWKPHEVARRVRIAFAGLSTVANHRVPKVNWGLTAAANRLRVLQSGWIAIVREVGRPELAARVARNCYVRALDSSFLNIDGFADVPIVSDYIGYTREQLTIEPIVAEGAGVGGLRGPRQARAAPFVFNRPPLAMKWLRPLLGYYTSRV